MEFVLVVLITVTTFGAVFLVLSLISWVVINCYFWWHSSNKHKKPKKITEEVIESEPNVTITERLASSAKQCLKHNKAL